MSLINDALKRAREIQRNDPPSGAPPLPPVELPPRGSAGWILAASAVLFLAAAGVIFGPALFGHKPPPPLAVKTIEIPSLPPVAAAPAPVINPTPVVTNVNSPAVAVENPTPATKTNAPAAPVVEEKWPRVQGIIFNAAQPLAIVNGQPVNAGDRVGNFQVKQITRNEVVFQREDGMQKTLGIGD
jgi:hypothetical protein